MPNSLLDFVMSLVRDPDAAAQYAADPTGAIADANLTDVTTADVDHLIPVVAESLSSTVPNMGADAFGGDAASNVWTSGAATAAFDAFDDHVPQQILAQQAMDGPGDVLTDLVGPAGGAVVDAPSADVPVVVGVDEPLVQDVSAFDVPALDVPALDVPDVEDVAAPDWTTTHLVGNEHVNADDATIDDLI